MQGLCAQLTGGVHLPSIYIYIYSVALCKASMLDCQGGLDLAADVVVFNASMLN